MNSVPSSRRSGSGLRLQAIAGFLSVVLGAVPTRGGEGAAPAYAIRDWHVQDGLPSEEVTAVAQDRRGYLWVTSGDAVLRFDGRNFLERRTPEPADGDAAAGARVTPEFGRDGAVLALGPGGILAFDPATDQAKQILPAEAGLQFTAVHAEPNGTLWVSRSDGAIVRQENGSAEVVRPFAKMDTSRPAAFATGGEGELWIMIGRSIGRRVQASWQPLPLETRGVEVRIASSRTDGPWLIANERVFKLVNGRPELRLTVPPLLGAHFIRALLEDRDGALWIGTRSQGLHVIAGETLTHVPTARDDILALCQSGDGSLWVGTSGDGLYRLRPRLARLFDKGTGLLDNRSETVCEDRDGTVWFANRDGGVANYRHGQINLVEPGPGQPRFSVGSVTPAPIGGVWVTSRRGVVHVSGTSPAVITPEPAVPSMQTAAVSATTGSGDLWLAVETDRIGRLRRGLFKTFGPAEGYAGGRVRSIAEDSAGRVWVGSEDGRLWQTEGNVFQAVPLALPAPIRPVQVMLGEADGTMWLGTAGSGLIIGRGPRWQVIDERDGLPDNTITQILRDERGSLWFGSSRGIFRLGAAELLARADNPGGGLLHPILLGKDEGLRNVSCLGSFQPAAWRSRDGRLWFATRSGVLAIDPTVDLVVAPPLRVAIEGLRCDGIARPMGAGMAIDSRVRKLEIRLSVLCLATPERVRTHYRLDGFDSDWVTAGPERIAAYPRLPPGDYRFRAMASAGAGAGNDDAVTWAFTVVPQWWQTIWFRLGTLVLAALAVALAVRAWYVRRLRRQLLRLEREHAIERERTRIAQNIHDDVGASLTRISLLTQTARGEDSDLGARLDQIYRTTTDITRAMDEIVWAVNPKYDDLDGLVYYLGNFAQSFLKLAGIRCRLKVPPTLASPHLTSQIRHNVFMACKEALHNVVKHSGASEAVLAITVAGGRLRVSLTDNGRGFDPAATPSSSPDRTAGGQGLNHMRERLAEAGGLCTIERVPTGGTAVVLELPLVQSA